MKRRDNHSQPEEEFWGQIKTSGMPLPIRQFEFAKCIGRKYRSDYGWPAERLLIEVDGGLFRGGRHSNGVGREADMERDALALALRYHTLRFSPRHVKSGWAIAMTRVALGLDELTSELVRAKEYGR